MQYTSHFVPRELKPDGPFSWLLGPEKANALVELNNALAEGPGVRQVTLDTVDHLNRKYKVDIHRRFRPELTELYRTFLRQCLRDRIFTQDETEDVWHLKSLFGISDRDHECL